MLINDKHKFIYIHIPKTGGTSIKKALMTVEGSEIKGVHMNCAEAKKAAGDKWDSYYKFTFVRNPFSRLVSWYHHILREKREGLKKENINDPGTFEKFVKNYKEIYKHKKLKSFSIFQNQLDFLHDGDCVSVDNIGAFEYLQYDFNVFCRHFGIEEIKLSHEKKWGDPNYRKYYNEELKEIVENRFKKDFECFGWGF